MDAMRDADTPPGGSGHGPGDPAHADREPRKLGLAERAYDLIDERGFGQGTIAMIAFLVALPVVVVAAHCLML
jgi:hypothetical protein